MLFFIFWVTKTIFKFYPKEKQGSHDYLNGIIKKKCDLFMILYVHTNLKDKKDLKIK